MLKSDYKDDLFAGSRKYTMVTNEDKTISLVDMTEYTQEGDQFGADDINHTNKEVNRLGNSVVVTLPASGWSSALPYAQTVSVVGMKATDVVEIHSYTPKELPAATVKQRRKLTGMITDGESGDGQMTFYCGEKKPDAELQVLLVGVSVQEGEM